MSFIDSSYIVLKFIFLIFVFFIIIGLSSKYYQKFKYSYELKNIKKLSNIDSFIDFSVKILSKDNFSFDKIKDNYIFFKNNIESDILNLSNNENLKDELKKQSDIIHKYTITNYNDGFEIVAYQDMINELIKILKILNV